MGLLDGAMESIRQPPIGRGSTHAFLTPIGVKNLVSLHPLHPKGFVCDIAQGTGRSLVATYPGITVLALVNLLAQQFQPFCRLNTINGFGGNQADHPAAITADIHLQRHTSYAAFSADALGLPFLGFSA